MINYLLSIVERYDFFPKLEIGHVSEDAFAGVRLILSLLYKHRNYLLFFFLHEWWLREILLHSFANFPCLVRRYIKALDFTFYSPMIML